MKEYINYQRKMIFLVCSGIIFIIIMACFAHSSSGSQHSYETQCYRQNGHVSRENCVSTLRIINGQHIVTQVCERRCVNNQTNETIRIEN